MRITRAHLLNDFEQLKTHLGLNLEIEWSGSPIRPRIFKVSDEDDISHLSPRLPIPEMHLWMEAFSDGFVVGFHKGRSRP